jgi:hypothetical protein
MKFMYRKYYPTLFIGGFLGLLIVSLLAHAAADTRYCNSRFGFCVEYPSEFGSEPAPDNNDGRVFFDRNGFRMTAAGINNVTDETLKSEIEGFLDRFDTVTYRTAIPNLAVSKLLGAHYGPQTGVEEPIFGLQSPLDLAF